MRFFFCVFVHICAFEMGASTTLEELDESLVH